MPIVLGGGIGGLSAAYYLLKKSNASNYVRLFEASNRFGGWIKTELPTENDKIRFECGPRTLRPKGIRGINTLAMCSELGLLNDVLPITVNHPAAKNRMLAVNNELCLLPSSLFAAFKTLPPFSKPLVYALVHDYTNKYDGKRLDDDSIYNFAERRFGVDIAKYLVGSMICGICAGDAKEISVKFLMKELFEFEQQHSSVTAGICRKTLKQLFGQKSDELRNDCALVQKSQAEKWSIYSLKGGLETLPKTLSAHLMKSNGVELKANAKCENIEFQQNRAIVSVNGKDYETSCLISSLPSSEIGKLLQKQHPLLANELLSIPYVDVAVVNLLYAGDNLFKTPGFGFLVPPSENLPILGVIYDSCCFDMGGNTVLTAMMGGKWFQEKFGNNPTETDLYKKATEQIRSILKIEQQPDAFKVNILRKCIPQYVIGHCDRVERIIKYIQEHKLPLQLCGSSYDGVGVNDVIYSAKVAVESI